MAGRVSLPRSSFHSSCEVLGPEGRLGPDCIGALWHLVRVSGMFSCSQARHSQASLASGPERHLPSRWPVSGPAAGGPSWSPGGPQMRAEISESPRVFAGCQCSPPFWGGGLGEPWAPACWGQRRQAWSWGWHTPGPHTTLPTALPGAPRGLPQVPRDVRRLRQQDPPRGRKSCPGASEPRRAGCRPWRAGPVRTRWAAARRPGEKRRPVQGPPAGGCGWGSCGASREASVGGRGGECRGSPVGHFFIQLLVTGTAKPGQR